LGHSLFCCSVVPTVLGHARPWSDSHPSPARFRDAVLQR
jgi:hypothetical protein